jgi:hypothetical protein
MRVTVAPPPGGLPAPAAGGGAAADPDDLGAFLQRLGLPHFQQPFADSGLDSVAKLAGLDSDSFKALKLRQVYFVNAFKLFVDMHLSEPVSRRPHARPTEVGDSIVDRGGGRRV